MRVPRGGAPALKRRILEPGTKWCGDCGRALPLSAFGSNAANADGLTAYCRPHHNERGKAFVKAKWGSARHYHLLRRYGVSEADVDAMLKRQNGLCAACGQKPAKHVDHDHETGKVRELLCFTCNVALGNVSDSIATLEALIAYLKKHQAKPLPAAAKTDKITIRIPTHRDFRFTVPARVTVIDLRRPTLVDGAFRWADNVTYETHLATR